MDKTKDFAHRRILVSIREVSEQLRYFQHTEYYFAAYFRMGLYTMYVRDDRKKLSVFYSCGRIAIDPGDTLEVAMYLIEAFV